MSLRLHPRLYITRCRLSWIWGWRSVSKVPAKLEMFCCEELPHGDTLRSDLSSAAALKGERRKDLTAFPLLPHIPLTEVVGSSFELVVALQLSDFCSSDRDSNSEKAQETRNMADLLLI
ncbi:unnamed protein product [Pleuronectes platessa]|uniref:Uncharacterized protein n=1 Tax=Pleuronectes platessa TaxID=8262 RepID=A0A9N7YJC1_PLEPL|nr:unnamed protein product [Pleuronectes platessa]